MLTSQLIQQTMCWELVVVSLECLWLSCWLLLSVIFHFTREKCGNTGKSLNFKFVKSKVLNKSLKKGVGLKLFVKFIRWFNFRFWRMFQFHEETNEFFVYLVLMALTLWKAKYNEIQVRCGWISNAAYCRISLRISTNSNFQPQHFQNKFEYKHVA